MFHIHRMAGSVESLHL